MTRVISALILLPVVVGIIWGLPPWGTQGLCLVVLVLCLREYDNLVARSGLDVVPGLSMALAVGMYGVLIFHLPAHHWLMLATVVTGIALVLRGRVPAQALAVAASTAFAVAYLGMGVATVPMVRELYGAAPLLTLILTQVASDTAQYYAGRAFGRAPSRVFLGLSAGLGRVWLPGIETWQLALLGVGVAIVGIAGDLFESMLKRSADVKDASGLIPGHGGMLDRIDALLFTMPLYYVALQWLWPNGPGA